MIPKIPQVIVVAENVIQSLQWLYFSLYKQFKKRNALLVCN